MESFTSYRTPWANASNTPFRLYKHWVHEGGVATPLVAYWPAVIKQRGGLTHEPGHLVDLMATCLDVAGGTYPQTYGDREITPLEGKSLVPALQGKEREGHDAIYWEHEGNRAMRQGKWKLVSRHPDNWELYDLDADRTEMNDLSSKHRDRMERMVGMYDQWAERCGVMPWEDVRRRPA